MMNIKTLGLIGGLAGTMTGCYTYYPDQAVVAPAPIVAPAPVVAPTIVAPAPAVVVPAYRPMWHGPRYHHHYHYRHRW